VSDDGRLQLRSVLQTKLGMPSRVEVWCGRELIGFITAAGTGVQITTLGDAPLEVSQHGTFGVSVRFHVPRS
jgi:hypothetical protein